MLGSWKDKDTRLGEKNKKKKNQKNVPVVKTFKIKNKCQGIKKKTINKAPVTQAGAPVHKPRAHVEATCSSLSVTPAVADGVGQDRVLELAG